METMRITRGMLAKDEGAAEQSTRSLRGSRQRPGAGGIRSRQTRSVDIAGSRTEELVALAVVLALAVVVWWWASRKIHQRKERGRRNATDARSEDEGSDLESGGDDMVNPAGSDIEPAGAADCRSTSGDDVESRRSDVESGSWGVRSRGVIGAAAGESSLSGEEQEQGPERSSCGTWTTAQTHDHPDDTDSCTLGSVGMAAAAAAAAGSPPSGRSVSRNSPQEASAGTKSSALAIGKYSQLTFYVRHYSCSSGDNNRSNNVHSQHRENNGDRDGNGDGNDDELDGHSVYHDVLQDAIYRARVTTGERRGEPERSVANGDLALPSGSGGGQAARGASIRGSGGRSSLSTITAGSYGPMEGQEEEEKREEERDGDRGEEEEKGGNVGDHISPSSRRSMPELEDLHETEPHLTETRTDRLVEIFSNAPSMATAVRDIYVASHCDLNLTASDSNGELKREEVIGAGYYGRVSRVRHKSLAEALALKELSEEAGDEHRSAAANEMDAFLSLGMHPNIPKVLALSSALPAMPILMELGFCDLVNVLESVNVSLPNTIGIIHDAACGLEHIHSKGMVHRDLKAANILVMVDADGHATGKVADFGLTCAQGEMTPARTGTPGYIPPELVWSGVEAGPENDVFSFGVLMLEVFIQPDLWENNMFVHRFLLTNEERAEFADLGEGNDQAVLALQFEVMVRTLLDGSFGRQIVQPENLAASVPYRYAVCGWLQACLCQPRHLRPSMASVVELLLCLKENREPPAMPMMWYM